MVPRRVPQPVPQRARVVPQDAEIRHLRAEPREQGREQHAVRIVDAAGTEGLARLGEFVAGREHRDPQAAAHRERGVSGGGGEREGRGREALARRDHLGAPRDVLARRAAVGAALEAGGQADALAREPHILLHEHRVGPGRHRRPGKDPHRRARRGKTRGRSAGGEAPAHRQHRLALGAEVGEAHRVAIHRGIGEGRQVEPGAQGLGGDAPVRAPQRHGLDAGDHRHPLGDQGGGRLHREQRPAEGEAIVRELRHGR